MAGVKKLVSRKFALWKENVVRTQEEVAVKRLKEFSLLFSVTLF